MTNDARLIFLAMLYAIGSLPQVASAQENVCRDKHWLDEPIIALHHGKGGDADDRDSGIGGTGQTEQALPDQIARREDEEGIGGTGIVGMIAGFGSLCIGGQEVFYDQNTPIMVNGQPVSDQIFGLGQMVSVRAKPLDPAVTENAYVATEIHLLHEVSGMVESVAEDKHSFSILGQQIHLAENTSVTLEQGDKIAVSGYRLPDGQIQATRIETSRDERLSLIGQVERVDEVQMVVSGQSIRLSEDQPRPSQGSEIRVEARLDKGELIATAWQDNPRMRFSAPVERVWIQRPLQMKDGKPEWQIQRPDRLDHPDHHEKHEGFEPRPPEVSAHHPERPDAPTLDRMNDMRPDLPRIERDHIDVMRQERFEVWRDLPRTPLPDRPILPEKPHLPEKPFRGER